jgi:hypothetical protein
MTLNPDFLKCAAKPQRCEIVSRLTGQLRKCRRNAKHWALGVVYDPEDGKNICLGFGNALDPLVVDFFRPRS